MKKIISIAIIRSMLFSGTSFAQKSLLFSMTLKIAPAIGQLIYCDLRPIDTLLIAGEVF